MAPSSDSCGSESPCWDVRSSFGVMLSPMVVRLRHYRCLVEATRFSCGRPPAAPRPVEPLWLKPALHVGRERNLVHRLPRSGDLQRWPGSCCPGASDQRHAQRRWRPFWEHYHERHRNCGGSCRRRLLRRPGAPGWWDHSKIDRRCSADPGRLRARWREDQSSDQRPDLPVSADPRLRSMSGCH